MQTTVKSSVSFSGVGLHSGVPSRVTIRPAPAGSGIRFLRTDIDVGNAVVPARWDAVRSSVLCTTLCNPAGVTVATVEHLMAALMGCGVHNALIEIDGPEVPILDGSALAFVRSITRSGLYVLPAPLRVFEVIKPVSVARGNASAAIFPARTMRIDFQIDFKDAAIGRQRKSLTMHNGSFARELCDSRTFCRKGDIAWMQSNGHALGGRPGENAVVFDGDLVSSPGGLRHADEPVRHKMLDALGDLALAGAPLIGHYVGVRAGHALTHRLLHAVFNTPGAIRMIQCDAESVARLPGCGLVWDETPAVA